MSTRHYDLLERATANSKAIDGILASAAGCPRGSRRRVLAAQTIRILRSNYDLLWSLVLVGNQP